MKRKHALSITDDPKLTKMLLEGRLIMLTDESDNLIDAVKGKIKEFDHIDYTYEDVEEEIRLMEKTIKSVQQKRDDITPDTLSFIIEDLRKQLDELRHLGYAIKD